MILVYLLFCIVIGLINSRTNVIFSLLLGIFGLNFFLNGNSLIGAAESLVAIPKVMLQNPQAILLVIIIILLFILSNLLNLINIDFILDRYVGRFSHRRQELITYLITFFSTNLDLSNSDIGLHHRKVYDLNSSILPFANPISIIVIFISTLLVMFDSVNGIGIGTATFIVLLNIPAIWWAFKSLVQLIYQQLPDYQINKQNMNLVRPSIEIHQSRVIQTSLNGRRFIKRCLQLIIPAILISFFVQQYQVFMFFIIYIILLISYSIYLGVKAVYEERIMAEEEIYRTIQNSVLGIGPELISFLLTLIFTSLSYDYIERFYANIYSAGQLYILAIIGLLIGMILFKDYLIGIAMALPITLIWITSNYAIDAVSIQGLYVSLISIATLIQIFYLVDMTNVTTRMIIDLTVLFIVTVSITLLTFLFGLISGFTLFVMYVLGYIIIYMFRNSRKTNDNIRHPQ